MKTIALLHLDLASGTEEKNAEILHSAVRRALRLGADWVVTPEMALQGYLYREKDKDTFDGRAAEFAEAYTKGGKGTLFFCGARKVGECMYNACAVLHGGKVIGTHHKFHSYQSGREGWTTNGTGAVTYDVDGVRTGVLICSDSYYDDSADMMREQNADIVLVPAAWPPAPCCTDPVAVWERFSRRSGRIIAVCNQTGSHEGLDMYEAPGAVAEEGKAKLLYEGNSAILLFDFDEERKIVASPVFRIAEA